ncbi:MAG TPA: DUF624 domain-containing protein [Anaerolineales bacterium]|nr:DUF624 domain-containing protein [Anaerolineales bacterium]
MAKAWEIIWEAFIDAWDAGLELVMINVFWFVFSVLVITLPPAQAGLYYATNQIAHREAISWRTFFVGFREYFWLSWRWTLLNLLVLIVIAANYIFYGRFDAGWARVVQALMPGLAGVWLALQTFTFPLLLEQADRRQWVALRNSAVLFVRFPLMGMTLLIVLLLFVAVSVLLQAPWLVLTAALNAFLANRVVVVALSELQAESPAG